MQNQYEFQRRTLSIFHKSLEQRNANAVTRNHDQRVFDSRQWGVADMEFKISKRALIDLWDRGCDQDLFHLSPKSRHVDCVVSIHVSKVFVCAEVEIVSLSNTKLIQPGEDFM